LEELKKLNENAENERAKIPIRLSKWEITTNDIIKNVRYSCPLFCHLLLHFSLARRTHNRKSKIGEFFGILLE